MKYIVILMIMVMTSCAGWQVDNTFRSVVKVYDKWGNTYACINESLLDGENKTLSAKCMFTTGEINGKIYRCEIAATTKFEGKEFSLSEDCKVIIDLEDIK